ncbi:hypothetical protein AMR71_09505 [Bacillus altitudinis]|nr:hypothetical protein [Bacillus altitudinis]ALM28924.1 hypothetical protein AKO65_13195 [Bacillus altitudinis]ALM45464.1 hypothetical protein AMR71_09505 [Bacillus altitudinis]ANY96943.1 hypothetical protein AKO66_09510 [Bacillus altitudinis]
MEIFNHENYEDMLAFVQSYIQDKEFTVFDHPTLIHPESFGVEIKIASTRKINNVASRFVLHFGTREDIEGQMDMKIEELKRLLELQ